MTTVTDNETDLIRRAQADDANAFCSLAERYARRIYLLAFHYCSKPQDAEDLSQEVWLKAYQALAGFRSGLFFLHVVAPDHDQHVSQSPAIEFVSKRAQTTVIELIDSDSTQFSSRARLPPKLFTTKCSSKPS